MTDPRLRSQYWRANLRVLALLLTVWFVASYVLGILLVEQLNQFHLGGFPLGFWMAQQGSIYVFVLLILAYAWWMGRVDAHLAAAIAASRVADDAVDGVRDAVDGAPAAGRGPGSEPPEDRA
jgi:putative solute:sodium symporter small subunit